MSQRESGRSREIMKALRLEGWFCFKFHGTEFTMSGVPDIICCAEGYFIGLETKHPESINDTSAKQERVHEQIKEAGGMAIVVYTPQQAVYEVKQHLAKLRSC